MGQQWAAATAAAHPNTDTAQQQAALALPSAIVLEAVRTRPRAQAGEARRTQGLLTKGACSRDGVNGLVWFSVLLFPDLLIRSSQLPAHPPAGQLFTFMAPSVHQEKGPLLCNPQHPPQHSEALPAWFSPLLSSVHSLAFSQTLTESLSCYCYTINE